MKTVLGYITAFIVVTALPVILFGLFAYAVTGHMPPQELLSRVTAGTSIFAVMLIIFVRL